MSTDTRYPCVTPAFSTQIDAKEYGRGVYQCIEGHFHAETPLHEWFVAEFSYAAWTECTCGYKPQSQEDMDAHGA